MKTKHIITFIACISLVGAAALSYAFKDSRKPLTEDQRNLKIHSCLINGGSFSTEFNDKRELVGIHCK